MRSERPSRTGPEGHNGTVASNEHAHSSTSSGLDVDHHFSRVASHRYLGGNRRANGRGSALGICDDCGRTPCKPICSWCCADLDDSRASAVFEPILAETGGANLAPAGTVFRCHEIRDRRRRRPAELAGPPGRHRCGSQFGFSERAMSCWRCSPHAFAKLDTLTAERPEW